MDKIWSELLNRSPTVEELQCHATNDLYAKRNDVLNCPEFQTSRKPSKKACILICGQVRQLDLCVKNWKEYLDFKNSDVFVSIQDSVCSKNTHIYKTDQIEPPRYLIQPVDTTQATKMFKSVFGFHLKYLHIRPNFEKLVMEQNSSLQILTNGGWTDVFNDLNLVLREILTRAEQYDSFLYFRADVMFPKPVQLYQMPQNTCSLPGTDVCLQFDKLTANRMVDYYDYLIKENAHLSTTKIAEDYMKEYIEMNNIGIIKQDWTIALPVSWLLSNLKVQDFTRVGLFSKSWQITLQQRCDQLVECTFFVC